MMMCGLTGGAPIIRTADSHLTGCTANTLKPVWEECDIWSAPPDT